METLRCDSNSGDQGPRGGLAFRFDVATSPDVDASRTNGSFEAVRDHALFLPEEELVAAVRAKELERRRVDAELAAMTAVLEHRGRYPDGHVTLKTFLRANLNLSGGTAHRQRQVSRLVAQFPEVGEAWIAGQLGRDQVIELAKLLHNRVVGKCFPAFADQLLDSAVPV